jgi:hypothetical protein
MNLSDLLSEDFALKLCLKSSIDTKELTKLIKRYPEEIVETILDLQRDMRKPQFLSLPSKKKQLKFMVRKKKLIIEFAEEKKNTNQVKFKSLLGQIYEEIMDENQVRVTHMQNFEHSIDEVDDMLSKF